MSAPDPSTAKPLLFQQSRVGYVDIDAVDLPRTNAAGKPVIDPTPEQRYLFDTQGWLLIPGLLSESEVEEMRAFCYRLHQQPESLPEPQRSPIGGPLEELTDHPFIVGFMNEFLANPDLSSQDCYGFRMESTSLAMRQTGGRRLWTPQRQWPVALARRRTQLPLRTRQGAQQLDLRGVGIERGRCQRRRHPIHQRQPQGRLSPARRSPKPRFRPLDSIHLSTRLPTHFRREHHPHRFPVGQHQARALRHLQPLQLRR